MGQILLPEDIENLTETGARTAELSPSIVNVGGQQYKTQILSINLDTSGVGGIDTGSVAPDTTYFVFVVRSGGANFLVASTSSLEPVGFTASRVIGALETDSSSNIDFVYETEKGEGEPKVSVQGTQSRSEPILDANNSEQYLTNIDFHENATVVHGTSSDVAGNTGETYTNPVLDGDITGTGVLDEDDMATDSNLKLATQQSIKAYVDAAVAQVATASAPTALVSPYAGATAPSGWLMCDGAAVSRTTYANLFNVLNATGLPYGPGDGATTFNLPDLRGRVVAGYDATPTGRLTQPNANVLGDGARPTDSNATTTFGSQAVLVTTQTETVSWLSNTQSVSVSTTSSFNTSSLSSSTYQNTHSHNQGSLYAAIHQSAGGDSIFARGVPVSSYNYNTIAGGIATSTANTSTTSGTDVLGSTGSTRASFRSATYPVSSSSSGSFNKNGLNSGQTAHNHDLTHRTVQPTGILNYIIKT